MDTDLLQNTRVLKEKLPNLGYNLCYGKGGRIRDTFPEPADGMTIHPAPIINLFQLKPSERPS